MGILTPREYAALLRTDLAAFIQRCFYELNPQTRFIDAWHIHLIASKLEACRKGKIKRLIINVPPRHLKTLCVSVAFSAWLLGHDATQQIIGVSYGQDFADKPARDTRTLMMTTWYRGLFPTRLSAEKQSVAEFVTTRQGYRLATSFGGVLTGRGANFIIIDDPHKPDEVQSDTRREADLAWYDNTLYSRQNDKNTACIIIIMQRLHMDDLVGHVLKQKGWEVVSLPAIAQADETFTIESSFGSRSITRKMGEALHPERESLETLGIIRSAIGEYNFSGQYLQMPAPPGGGMIKEAWFPRYKLKDRPERFDLVLQSWDTANKATELSDYSVCTTWGIQDQRLFLLNVVRKRLLYPDLKRAVIEQAEAYKPSVILIEDKASGTQLIQELVEAGLQSVTRCESRYDKVMRMSAQTGVMENGFVHLPEQAHWLEGYLLELMTFPNSAFDDQVDSTSQALAWVKQRPPGWGVFEYYRSLHECSQSARKESTALVKILSGSSHVYLLDGTVVMVGADGIIEVSEENAKPLLMAGHMIVE